MTTCIFNELFSDHPKHIDIKGSLKVIEGDSLTLSCTAEAFPDNIEFSWIHPAGTTPGDTLEILFTTYKHAGTYICTAENEFQPCNGDVQRNGQSFSEDVVIQCKS